MRLHHTIAPALSLFVCSQLWTVCLAEPAAEQSLQLDSAAFTVEPSSGTPTKKGASNSHVPPSATSGSTASTARAPTSQAPKPQALTMPLAAPQLPTARAAMPQAAMQQASTATSTPRAATSQASTPTTSSGEQQAEALYQDGITQMQLAKYDSAVQKFEAALAIVQKAEYFEAIATAFQKLNQLDKAELALRRGISLYPNNSRLLSALNGVLTVLTMKQSRQSIAGLGVPTCVGRETKVVEVEETTHEFPGQGQREEWERACVLSNEGNALLIAGEYDKAIVQLRGAIIIYPFDADFHHNLGIALMKKGDLEHAVSALRDALKLKPDDYTTATYLGSVLYDLKRYKEAKEAFLQAANSHPTAAERSRIEQYLSALSNVKEF